MFWSLSFIDFVTVVPSSCIHMGVRKHWRSDHVSSQSTTMSGTASASYSYAVHGNTVQSGVGKFEADIWKCSLSHLGEQVVDLSVSWVFLAGSNRIRQPYLQHGSPSEETPPQHCNAVEEPLTELALPLPPEPGFSMHLCRLRIAEAQPDAPSEVALMSPVEEKHIRRAAISVAQGTLIASVRANRAYKVRGGRK